MAAAANDPGDAFRGEHLVKIGVNSPEGGRLRQTLNHSNVDPDFWDRYWRISTIYKVNNERLIKAFYEFKNELKQSDLKPEQYREVCVFSNETKKTAEEISQDGNRVGVKKWHVLGHAGSGIHLVRHYDILSRYLAVKHGCAPCYIMVYKAILGKTKPIVPRVHKEDNFVKPYVGFDCHVSARRVQFKMPISDAYKCSHVFFYEYDGKTSLPVECPRQILPHAVIQLEKKHPIYLETPFLAVGTKTSQWEVKGETRRGFRFVLAKQPDKSVTSPLTRKRKIEELKTNLKDQLLEMRTRWPDSCTPTKLSKQEQSEGNARPSQFQKATESEVNEYLKDTMLRRDRRRNLPVFSKRRERAHDKEERLKTNDEKDITIDSNEKCDEVQKHSVLVNRNNAHLPLSLKPYVSLQRLTSFTQKDNASDTFITTFGQKREEIASHMDGSVHSASTSPIDNSSKAEEGKRNTVSVVTNSSGDKTEVDGKIQTTDQVVEEKCLAGDKVIADIRKSKPLNYTTLHTALTSQEDIPMKALERNIAFGHSHVTETNIKGDPLKTVENEKDSTHNKQRKKSELEEQGKQVNAICDVSKSNTSDINHILPQTRKHDRFERSPDLISLFQKIESTIPFKESIHKTSSNPTQKCQNDCSPDTNKSSESRSGDSHINPMAGNLSKSLLDTVQVMHNFKSVSKQNLNKLCFDALCCPNPGPPKSFNKEATTEPINKKCAGEQCVSVKNQSVKSNTDAINQSTTSASENEVKGAHLYQYNTKKSDCDFGLHEGKSCDVQYMAIKTILRDGQNKSLMNIRENVASGYKKGLSDGQKTCSVAGRKDVHDISLCDKNKMTDIAQVNTEENKVQTGKNTKSICSAEMSMFAVDKSKLYPKRTDALTMSTEKVQDSTTSFFKPFLNVQTSYADTAGIKKGARCDLQRGERNSEKEKSGGRDITNLCDNKQRKNTDLTHKSAEETSKVANHRPKIKNVTLTTHDAKSENVTAKTSKLQLTPKNRVGEIKRDNKNQITNKSCPKPTPQPDLVTKISTVANANRHTNTTGKHGSNDTQDKTDTKDSDTSFFKPFLKAVHTKPLACVTTKEKVKQFISDAGRSETQENSNIERTSMADKIAESKGQTVIRQGTTGSSETLKPPNIERISMADTTTENKGQTVTRQGTTGSSETLKPPNIERMSMADTTAENKGQTVTRQGIDGSLKTKENPTIERICMADTTAENKGQTVIRQGTTGSSETLKPPNIERISMADTTTENKGQTVTRQGTTGSSETLKPPNIERMSMADTTAENKGQTVTRQGIDGSLKTKENPTIERICMADTTAENKGQTVTRQGTAGSSETLKPPNIERISMADTTAIIKCQTVTRQSTGSSETLKPPNIECISMAGTTVESKSQTVSLQDTAGSLDTLKPPNIESISMAEKTEESKGQTVTRQCTTGRSETQKENNIERISMADKTVDSKSQTVNRQRAGSSETQENPNIKRISLVDKTAESKGQTVSLKGTAGGLETRENTNTKRISMADKTAESRGQPDTRQGTAGDSKTKESLDIERISTADKTAESKGQSVTRQDTSGSLETQKKTNIKCISIADKTAESKGQTVTLQGTAGDLETRVIPKTERILIADKTAESKRQTVTLQGKAGALETKENPNTERISIGDKTAESKGQTPTQQDRAVRSKTQHAHKIKRIPIIDKSAESKVPALTEQCTTGSSKPTETPTIKRVSTTDKSTESKIQTLIQHSTTVCAKTKQSPTIENTPMTDKSAESTVQTSPQQMAAGLSKTRQNPMIEKLSMADKSAQSKLQPNTAGRPKTHHNPTFKGNASDNTQASNSSEKIQSVTAFQQTEFKPPNAAEVEVQNTSFFKTFLKKAGTNTFVYHDKTSKTYDAEGPQITGKQSLPTNTTVDNIPSVSPTLDDTSSNGLNKCPTVLTASVHAPSLSVPCINEKCITKAVTQKLPSTITPVKDTLPIKSVPTSNDDRRGLHISDHDLSNTHSVHHKHDTLYVKVSNEYSAHNRQFHGHYIDTSDKKMYPQVSKQSDSKREHAPSVIYPKCTYEEGTNVDSQVLDLRTKTKASHKAKFNEAKVSDNPLEALKSSVTVDEKTARRIQQFLIQKLSSKTNTSLDFQLRPRASTEQTTHSSKSSLEQTLNPRPSNSTATDLLKASERPTSNTVSKSKDFKAERNTSARRETAPQPIDCHTEKGCRMIELESNETNTINNATRAASKGHQHINNHNAESVRKEDVLKPVSSVDTVARYPNISITSTGESSTVQVKVKQREQIKQEKFHPPILDKATQQKDNTFSKERMSLNNGSKQIKHNDKEYGNKESAKLNSTAMTESNSIKDATKQTHYHNTESLRQEDALKCVKSVDKVINYSNISRTSTGESSSVSELNRPEQIKQENFHPPTLNNATEQKGNTFRKERMSLNKGNTQVKQNEHELGNEESAKLNSFAMKKSNTTKDTTKQINNHHAEAFRKEDSLKRVNSVDTVAKCSHISRTSNSESSNVSKVKRPEQNKQDKFHPTIFDKATEQKGITFSEDSMSSTKESKQAKHNEHGHKDSAKFNSAVITKSTSKKDATEQINYHNTESFRKDVASQNVNSVETVTNYPNTSRTSTGESSSVPDVKRPEQIKQEKFHPQILYNATAEKGNTFSENSMSSNKQSKQVKHNEHEHGNKESAKLISAVCTQSNSKKDATKMTQQECKSAILQTLNELSTVLKVLNESKSTKEQTHTKSVGRNMCSGSDGCTKQAEISVANKHNSVMFSNSPAVPSSKSISTEQKETTLFNKNVDEIKVSNKTPECTITPRSTIISKDIELNTASENKCKDVLLDQVRVKIEPVDTVQHDTLCKQSSNEFQETNSNSTCSSVDTVNQTNTSNDFNKQTPINSPKSFDPSGLAYSAEKETCKSSHQHAHTNMSGPHINRVAEELSNGKTHLPVPETRVGSSVNGDRSLVEKQTCVQTIDKEDYQQSLTENEHNGYTRTETCLNQNVSNESRLVRDRSLCCTQSSLTINRQINAEDSTAVHSNIYNTHTIKASKETYIGKTNSSSSSDNDNNSSGEHFRDESIPATQNLTDGNNMLQTVRFLDRHRSSSRRRSRTASTSEDDVVYSYSEVMKMKYTQFKKFKMGYAGHKYIDYDEVRCKGIDKIANPRRSREGIKRMFKESVSCEMPNSSNKVGDTHIKQERHEMNETIEETSAKKYNQVKDKKRATHTATNATRSISHRPYKPFKSDSFATATNTKTNREQQNSKQTVRKSGTGYFRWRNKYPGKQTKPPSKKNNNDKFFITKSGKKQSKDEFIRWTRFKERESIRNQIEQSILAYKKTFAHEGVDNTNMKVASYLESLSQPSIGRGRTKERRIKKIVNSVCKKRETTPPRFAQQPVLGSGGRSFPVSVGLGQSDGLFNNSASRPRSSHDTRLDTLIGGFNSTLPLTNDIAGALSANVMELLIRQYLASNFAHFTQKVRDEMSRQMLVEIPTQHSDKTSVPNSHPGYIEPTSTQSRRRRSKSYGSDTNDAYRNRSTSFDKETDIYDKSYPSSFRDSRKVETHEPRRSHSRDRARSHASSERRYSRSPKREERSHASSERRYSRSPRREEIYQLDNGHNKKSYSKESKEYVRSVSNQSVPYDDYNTGWSSPNNAHFNGYMRRENNKNNNEAHRRSLSRENESVCFVEEGNRRRSKGRDDEHLGGDNSSWTHGNGEDTYAYERSNFHRMSRGHNSSRERNRSTGRYDYSREYENEGSSWSNANISDDGRMYNYYDEHGLSNPRKRHYDEERRHTDRSYYNSTGRHGKEDNLAFSKQEGEGFTNAHRYNKIPRLDHSDRRFKGSRDTYTKNEYDRLSDRDNVSAFNATNRGRTKHFMARRDRTLQAKYKMANVDPIGKDQSGYIDNTKRYDTDFGKHFFNNKRQPSSHTSSCNIDTSDDRTKFGLFGDEFDAYTYRQNDSSAESKDPKKYRYYPPKASATTKKSSSLDSPECQK